MPLLNLVVMLIVVGVGLYLINRFIPMASSIKTILNVVVVVVVCIWLLQVTGLWAKCQHVPRLAMNPDLTVFGHLTPRGQFFAGPASLQPCRETLSDMSKQRFGTDGI